MTTTASVSGKKHTATPPLLLLAVLLFWGWQSGLLIFGAVMGVVLESPRLIKLRFDFSVDDFRRIWNFCGLLGFALVLYAFTANEEGGGITGLFHGQAGHNAVISGMHAVTTVPRWLPMIFFLVMAAHNFSERESIPLSAISMFFQWKQRQARGEKPEWYLNVSYAYFAVCLISAGIHANEGTKTYFWGQSVLLAWALWPLRPRRFNRMIWGGSWLLAIGLAYFGTRGISQLESLAQNYNAQWMTRLMHQRTDALETMTAIGQIGQMKLSGSIVIRLETQNGASPPTYLHEASYYNYHAQTWRAGIGGALNEFDNLLPLTNGGSTFDVLPGRTGSHEVNIACYLNGWDRELDVPEGLLPLPTGCNRLANVPSEVVFIKKNRTGAVLTAGPGLVIFDAQYGAAAAIDSPVNTNWDLEVPTNELPALLQVTKEMKFRGESDEEKELAVAQFFSSKFSYRTWQEPDKSRQTNSTPLGRFLLQTRAGHCEYFATATVLLLRELNIPARYAVGYFVHEQHSDDHYVVRERDAHAWCLVWDKKAQVWKDFDTTPGSWVGVEGQRATIMQSVSDFFSWLQFQFSKFRYGQSHWRNYILWTVIPLMGLLLAQIIFRRGRRRHSGGAGKARGAGTPWPGLDSEFYRLESRLAAQGVPRQPGEALTDWVERLLGQKQLADLRAPLQETLRLHYRHRFDPHGLEAEERQQLKESVSLVLSRMTEK